MTPQENAESLEPGAGLMALGYRRGACDPGDGPDDSGGEWDTIGQYELIEPLGEGGFGMVWRAGQRDPIRREVALKVIKSGLDSREVICRFEAERRALALMDHPNIATVFDAGTTADGRPFFVMELVQGPPLTEYCDARQLTLRERIALFIPVCQAVQHAHQKAVIHRDLKPSNILVAEIDGRPVPKIIDFGIAKALDPSADPNAGSFGRTQAGMVVGTPQYMSPEQAGCGLDVDTRSDVYSLGVILCELLTGRTPLSPGGWDFAGALRLICESAALKPSALIQPVTDAVLHSAAQRQIPVSRFGRILRGDLDWITLKALEKDRCRRYETALALATDLQRYLAGKTVSAVAPTWRYQAGKFVRRHRGPLIAACLAVTALLTGAGVGLWQAGRAEESRVNAKSNYERARKAVEVFLNVINDHPRLAQEDFRDLKLTFLKNALALYKDMTPVEGDDPDLQSNRAWALGRIGNICQQMGDYAQAEPAYRATLEIETVLVRKFPDKAAYRQALAMRYNNLSVVQYALHRNGESLANQEKALSLLETLFAQEPNHPEYARQMGAILLNRGTLLRDAEQPAEAEACFQRAAGLNREMMMRNPQDALYRKEFAACRLTLGNLFEAAGRKEEALKSWREARENFAQVAKADPSNHEVRSSLVACLLCEGRGAFGTGDNKGGDEFLRQAREGAQQIVDEYPAYPEYRERLVNTLRTIADALSQRGRDDEAEAVQQDIRVEQQRMITAFPRSKKYPPMLAATLSKLGDCAAKRREFPEAKKLYEQALAVHRLDTHNAVLCEIALSMRDHATAVQQAAASTELSKSNWQKREWAAQRMMRAAALVKDDANLNAEEKEKAIESYVRQAVSMLAEAVELGYCALSEFYVPAQGIDLKERADFRAVSQKAQLPAGMASRCLFDYPRDDDPGVRKWVREGFTWRETQPSGKINEYAIAGPLTVEGVRGIEVRAAGGGRRTLFVPNADSAPPLKLRMKVAGGNWRVLGELTDIK
ncbi:MAG TPA: serine/threonine-protein kinase [Verrucomicrobiales bacterium]|nr:serine/threonine-protein kinase [Verrucomicrobiales bacterium]